MLTTGALIHVWQFRSSRNVFKINGMSRMSRQYANNISAQNYIPHDFQMTHTSFRNMIFRNPFEWFTQLHLTFFIFSFIYSYQKNMNVIIQRKIHFKKYSKFYNYLYLIKDKGKKTKLVFNYLFQNDTK